jgi:DNA-3-methyladenine glycosylase II
LITDYTNASRYLAALDEDWARLIETVGSCTHRPKPEREPYEALVRAVAYQQLHTRAGDLILARFLALYGGNMPEPQQLILTEFDALRACGFSGRKIQTLKGIAEAAISGLVPSRDIADAMSDEELIMRLVQLKGIGRWTVEMLLIFTLAREDILPADDFGVRDGYRRLKVLDNQPTPKALAEIGLAWQPYRTIAAWYLWRVPK